MYTDFHWGVWSSKELRESHCSIKHTLACWHFTLWVCVGEFVWGRNLERERGQHVTTCHLYVYIHSSVNCHLQRRRTMRNLTLQRTQPSYTHTQRYYDFMLCGFAQQHSSTPTATNTKKCVSGQESSEVISFGLWSLMVEDNICYAMLLEWVLKKKLEKSKSEV